MKNSADQEECYPLRLKAKVDNILRDLQNSSYPTKAEFNNCFYYSFKIFSRFWLVKTTRIIHHNQMLFTRFEKHFRHMESMTSKVERIENYWTNDVKMASKVQPAADYWTIDRENLGTRLCYIWWAEKQRAKWWNSSVDNTLLDLQNSSYPTQPHSIIANYLLFSQNIPPS